MARKAAGIGAVYGSTTESIATVFRTVNKLASAGEQLAGNAEVQAMISRIESSNSLLEAMGVDSTNQNAAERIANAASLMEALRNM